MKKVDVFVKGPGSGRETAIRSLQAAGLEVGSITDVTPQAHTAAALRSAAASETSLGVGVLDPAGGPGAPTAEQVHPAGMGRRSSGNRPGGGHTMRNGVI